jgi:hypothetical protein
MAETQNPGLAYELANTNEAALAARQLGVQTTFLAQVLVDSGVITTPPRLVRKEAARFLRRRAGVIGPHDHISTELLEMADQLEAP